MSTFNVELKKVVDDSYEIEVGHGLEQKLISDINAGLVGNIKKFDSSRSLISWIGLTPRNAQSGTSIHKNGSISRMGCTRLRGQFYMCAVVAIKYNPDCRAFYDRLKESGKPSKVALIAVANKLLRQLYAVLTKKEAYVPNFCTKAS